jgi:acyl dehydratase
MPEFADLRALRAAVGTTFGPSSGQPITQDMIDQFADLTHDHQWLHVDVERARHSALGTTIAHGYLTLTLAAPFLEELVRVGNVESAVNYGANRLRFPAPVPAGSLVHAEATPVSVEDRPGGADAVIALVMRTATSSKPVCAVEVVLRYTAAREGAPREEFEL